MATIPRASADGDEPGPIPPQRATSRTSHREQPEKTLVKPPRLRGTPDLLRPQPYRGLKQAPLRLTVEPRNIVILGGSFGGLSCAHYILDHVLGALAAAAPDQSFRVLVVSPSTHVYWNIGAPRALVGRLVPPERMFVPIAAGFERHAGRKVSVLQGRAIGWNVEQRTIAVEMLAPEVTSPFVPEQISSRAPWRQNQPSTTPQKPRNNVQSVKYHALIICTGTSAHSDLLSLHGPHEETLASLKSWHKSVEKADRIIIGGGGTSGVEVAGQLATYLNYDRHFPMRRRARRPKEIILITGSDRCLPKHLNEDISTRAEMMLRDLGVRILHNVRVLAATLDRATDGPGPRRTRVALSNGNSLTTDLYISCTGVVPNSEFVPDALKDKHGYVVTDGRTMRVPAGGERVYCIGDVASYSQNYVLDVYAAVPTAMQNLLNDLLRHVLQGDAAREDARDVVAGLQDAEYQQRPVDSQLCPISRFGGVGILLGMRMPSFMVHLLKGHDYRIGKAKKVVGYGWNPYASKSKYE